jgi:acyl-CoA thioesterase FadM
LAVELNVRFSRKVAVGEQYLIVAKLEADRGRVWESSAELRDAAGKVCAYGTCKQMPIDAAAMRHAAVDFMPDPATAAATALFPDLTT